MHFKSRKFSLELGIIFWIAAASVGLFGCEGLLLSSCLPLAVSVPAGYLLWSEKSHPFLENFLIKKICWFHLVSAVCCLFPRLHSSVQ